MIDNSLDVCLPQFIFWNSNLHGDGIRNWCYNATVIMNGSIAPCEDTFKVSNYEPCKKQDPTKHLTYTPFDIGFPASTAVRNLVYRPCNYGPKGYGEIPSSEFHLIPSWAAVLAPVSLMERDSHQTTGRQAGLLTADKWAKTKLTLQHEDQTVHWQQQSLPPVPGQPFLTLLPDCGVSG